MKRFFVYNGQILDRVDSYTNEKILSADSIAIEEVALAMNVDIKTVSTFKAEDTTVRAPQVYIPAATIPPPKPAVAEIVATLFDYTLLLAAKAGVSDEELLSAPHRMPLKPGTVVTPDVP